MNQSDLTALRAVAAEEDQAGTFAVLVPNDSPLGEAVTLAAALSTTTERTLLGVAANLEEPAHRHPTVLARDMTTLDLLSQGRALLVFAGPFTDATTEAATLCRDMWRNGVAASEGPNYPVAGAINRPSPFSAATPKIALDTTQGHAPPPDLLELADFLLQDRQGDGCQIVDA